MKRMLPVLCLLLAACVAPPAAAPTDVPATAAPTEPPFVPTDAPAGAEPTAAPVPTVAGTLPLEALAPERIEFAAEDGTPLVGTYFPPAQPEAPGVVLVHMLNRSR
ncbi:MAG: hypothetical protein GYB64_09250, partial [Chloroflexi bacterium]|nr:hypothetical protein [Chloroflexota bacterium]